MASIPDCNWSCIVCAVPLSSLVSSVVLIPAISLVLVETFCSNSARPSVVAIPTVLIVTSFPASETDMFVPALILLATRWFLASFSSVVTLCDKLSKSLLKVAVSLSNWSILPSCSVSLSFNVCISLSMVVTLSVTCAMSWFTCSMSPSIVVKCSSVCVLYSLKVFSILSTFSVSCVRLLVTLVICSVTFCISCVVVCSIPSNKLSTSSFV